MNRKLAFVSGWIIVLSLLTGCASLRTARIRKDVTIKTYNEPGFEVERNSTFAVIPVFHKNESVSGISYNASEAAADLMSVKLWIQGFQVVDKVFIKRTFSKEGVEFKDISVKQAVHVGKVLKTDYIMLVSLTEHEEDTRSIDFGPFKVVNTVDTSVLVGLNCRLVDVAARRIIWSGIATTQDKNLQLCIRRISQQLIDSFKDDKNELKPKG